MSWFPRRGESGVEVVLVELVWGVEEGREVRLYGAALSYGVLLLSSCLGLGVIFFTLSGVGLLGLL